MKNLLEKIFIETPIGFILSFMVILIVPIVVLGLNKNQFENNIKCIEIGGMYEKIDGDFVCKNSPSPRGID